jgi:hypothetical protein
MKRRRYVIGLVVATAALAGCGGDDDEAERPAQPAAKTVAGSWAGKVAGTDAFIAVVSRADGTTLAYVCDNQKIAKLLRGPQRAGSFALSRSGTKIEGDLADDAARGTVTLNGNAHSFTAARSTGDAGLYWATTRRSGQRAVAAWVVLEDGAQRGNITTTTRTTRAPTLNPATGSAGALQAQGSSALKIVWPGGTSSKEGSTSQKEG